MFTIVVSNAFNESVNLSKSIFEWFENNGMKANPDKCHLLLSKNENFDANVNENRIYNSKFEKLLGVTFDSQLNFNHHIFKICKTFMQ